MTYVWTFEPGSIDNVVQTFDFDAYAVIDDSDGSITLDVMAFENVTDVESYAFVLTGETNQQVFYISGHFTREFGRLT